MLWPLRGEEPLKVNFWIKLKGGRNSNVYQPISDSGSAHFLRAKGRQTDNENENVCLCGLLKPPLMQVNKQTVA